MPVLTLNVLLVSPALAQQGPPPAPLIAAPDSQPASAVAESTDTAAPAPAKTKSTAQSKKQENCSNQATLPPSSTPLLAEGIRKPAFFETLALLIPTKRQ